MRVITLVRMVCVAVAALGVPPQATAQEAPRRLELKGVGGWTGFLDEATIDHFVLGAAVQVGLSPRFALEPEFLYMRESELDQDFVLQLSLVGELTSGGRVRPYLVAGAGLLNQRAKFPGAIEESFSATEFTGGGGAGVRVGLSDRLSLSPEVRLGWEPLYRVTVALGWRFR